MPRWTRSAWLPFGAVVALIACCAGPALIGVVGAGTLLVIGGVTVASLALAAALVVGTVAVGRRHRCEASPATQEREEPA